MLSKSSLKTAWQTRCADAEPAADTILRGAAAHSVRGIKGRALDAAVAIVKESGIKGLSLRGLADRANFGVASLYHYFSNKEELLLCLAVNGFARLRDAILEAHDTIDLPNPISRSATAYFDFVANNCELFALMYDVPRMQAYPELRAAEHEAFLAFEEAVVADSRLPSQKVASTMWALYRGVAAIASAQPNRRLSPAQYEAIWGGAAYLLVRS